MNILQSNMATWQGKLIYIAHFIHNGQIQSPYTIKANNYHLKIIQKNAFLVLVRIIGSSVLYELQLYGHFGKANKKTITIVHPAGNKGIHEFLHTLIGNKMFL